ncbi:hypothetical protein BDP27DRAFT_1362024 [Rhodocollybia butyracea]|uniref:Uncharacterized protein n=1 Tax=Rhodocollybia butyracea TaxID=206335 RepID=A0A9P5PXV8_9AGAR|nr:hypothetical protein BDP27DRAFT_1362024 [Rhodocollybia butyracea]
MGQAPAIIVDTYAFNTTSTTSGLWNDIDIGAYGIGNPSIQLSAPSSVTTGIVGDFSIEVGLEFNSTIVLEGQWQDSSPGGGPGTSSAITGATMKFPFTGWNITLLGFFESTTLEISLSVFHLMNKHKSDLNLRVTAIMSSRPSHPTTLNTSPLFSRNQIVAIIPLQLRF